MWQILGAYLLGHWFQSLDFSKHTSTGLGLPALCETQGTVLTPP